MWIRHKHLLKPIMLPKESIFETCGFSLIIFALRITWLFVSETLSNLELHEKTGLDSDAGHY